VKRNKLAPAVAVVGAAADKLKWPNLVAIEDSDYVVVVQQDEFLSGFPIDKAIAALERERSQFLSLTVGRDSPVPFMQAVIVRADVFSAYQMAAGLHPLKLERAWAVADNPIKLGLRGRGSKVSAISEPKSDLTALKAYLAEAKSLANLLEQTRGAEAATSFINENVICGELVSYFHAIYRESVLFFGNLKLLLVGSGLTYRSGASSPGADRIAEVFSAVKLESRANVLRLLGDSPETSLFY